MGAPRGNRAVRAGVAVRIISGHANRMPDRAPSGERRAADLAWARGRTRIHQPARECETLAVTYHLKVVLVVVGALATSALLWLVLLSFIGASFTPFMSN